MKNRPLLFLLVLLMPAFASAGPKMKLLYQNMLLMKNATMLVPPVLADPHTMEEIRAKEGDAGVAEYLKKIQEINQNMKQYLESEFTFCKMQFLFDEPRVQSYAEYFQFFRQYPKDEYFVLQFGNAVQYAGGSYKRMPKYDTAFMGVFETDGTTRVYLNVGDIKRMNQDHYAQSIIHNLQINLTRYHTLAEKQAKKGKIRKKKPQPVSPDQKADPETSTAVDAFVIPLQKVKLENPGDSVLFVNGKWRTVQTTKEITLYRYFGGPAALIQGSDATTSRFVSPDEARGLLALPDARNMLDNIAEIKVPAGTLLNVGKAAPYPAAQPLYPGGADRILFVGQWKADWLVSVTNTRDRSVKDAAAWFADHPRW